MLDGDGLWVQADVGQELHGGDHPLVILPLSPPVLQSVVLFRARAHVKRVEHIVDLLTSHLVICGGVRAHGDLDCIFVVLLGLNHTSANHAQIIAGWVLDLRGHHKAT